MATISTLVPYVASRVDEPSGPVFWSANELTSAISEAMCDLMLLVARPDLIVSVPFTVQPNTPYQQTPEGVFAITNIQGPVSEVWKVTLQDLDGAQVAGPDWEQDIGPSITTWAATRAPRTRPRRTGLPQHSAASPRRVLAAGNGTGICS